MVKSGEKIFRVIDQRVINVKLPKGYCADEHARVLTDVNATSVITNCVYVKQKNT